MTPPYDDLRDDRVPSSLGPCCICRGRDNVGSLLMLDFRAPEPGAGWGCIVCGIANDGATAVLCDDCFELWENGAKVVDVCAGYVGEGRRVALADFPQVAFGHKPGCGATMTPEF